MSAAAGVGQRERDAGRCPLCGDPMYGWLTLPGERSGASVGAPLGDAATTRVVDRCERCGAALERGRQVDLADELRAVTTGEGEGRITIESPNRAGLAAAIGADGWSRLDRLPGALALTPRSLELLAERNGRLVERISFPAFGPNQGAMWQTLLNGLTFHANFVTDVCAGRLRPTTGRGRLAFAADVVVSALAAPLVALLSVPLEAVAALVRRGGTMRAAARPR